jgi:hypothetical protein
VFSAARDLPLAKRDGAALSARPARCSAPATGVVDMAFLHRHRSETLILHARGASDFGAQAAAGLAGVIGLLALIQHLVP